MKKDLNQKLNKYINLTKKAIKLAEKSLPKNKKDQEAAKTLLNLSKCYFKDSLYFKEKGDLVNAFASINYSHAFLDAGSILKIFKTKDNKLFMCEE